MYEMEYEKHVSRPRLTYWIILIVSFVIIIITGTGLIVYETISNQNVDRLLNQIEECRSISTVFPEITTRLPESKSTVGDSSAKTKPAGWIQALTTAFGILTLFSIMMIIITCNFWLSDKDGKNKNLVSYYSEDVIDNLTENNTELTTV
ncbi:U91 protein [macacine betaherpesvirus 9]|uniref:U91 protein n=1 Tax=macacine betaherpesvirus 9 TaxID=2560568 RepID=A0A191S3W1_9BETA|nr:U91 protein [macacine betaherpesvirus 9]ANC96585.1 U91 protein [macacine betaherpesvirus 9]